MKIVFLACVCLLVGACVSSGTYTPYRAWPIESDASCREDCVRWRMSMGATEQQAIDTCTQQNVCREPQVRRYIENQVQTVKDLYWRK